MFSIIDIYDQYQNTEIRHTTSDLSLEMDEDLRARLLDPGEIELTTPRVIMVTEAEAEGDTLVSLVSCIK